MLARSLSSSFCALIFVLLSRGGGADTTACYGLNGNQDPDQYPCEATTNISACCKAGDVCYTNSLCSPGPQSEVQLASGIYIYSGCTDPTLQDPACLTVCHAVGGAFLQACPEANLYFCGIFVPNQCNNQSAVFTLPAGTVVTTLPGPTSTSPVLAISSASFSTNTTVTLLTSTSHTFPTTTDSASPNKKPDTDHAKTVGIGIGLGIGIGATLISGAMIAWIILRIRIARKRRVAQTIGINAQVNGRWLRFHNPVEVDAKGRSELEHKSPATELDAALSTNLHGTRDLGPVTESGGQVSSDETAVASQRGSEGWSWQPSEIRLASGR